MRPGGVMRTLKSSKRWPTWSSPSHRERIPETQPAIDTDIADEAKLRN
jgi:hypothetical protein